MSGAHRQKKLRKYEVTVTRTVVFTQVVALEARNADEACDIAAANVDEDSLERALGDLRGEIIGEGSKAKVLR
jgi:hypothetical protein